MTELSHDMRWTNLELKIIMKDMTNVTLKKSVDSEYGDVTKQN